MKKRLIVMLALTVVMASAGLAKADTFYNVLYNAFCLPYGAGTPGVISCGFYLNARIKAAYVPASARGYCIEKCVSTTWAYPSYATTCQNTCSTMYNNDLN